MDTKTLIAQQKRLCDRIWDEYPHDARIEPIYDGVRDPEAYLASSPQKIMWGAKGAVRRVR
jgi:hypothetical protein